MANPKPSKPFVKGDPRINRKGKPKGFDALRELAQSIAHEVAQSDGEPVIINGHKATIVEVVLRQWWNSTSPVLQRGAMEVAFGKVPDKLEVTGEDGGRIKIEAYEYNNAIAVITSGPGPDSETPS
jgi:hypothetical protein